MPGPADFGKLLNGCVGCVRATSSWTQGVLDFELPLLEQFGHVMFSLPRSQGGVDSDCSREGI